MPLSTYLLFHTLGMPLICFPYLTAHLVGPQAPAQYMDVGTPAPNTLKVKSVVVINLADKILHVLSNWTEVQFRFRTYWDVAYKDKNLAGKIFTNNDDA